MGHEPFCLSIDIPRFRLSFVLNNNGELESNNMHGMVIDQDQCTGTMIGLSSQLVLRRKEPIFTSLPRSRIVIIPYGKVHYSVSPSKNHVRIRIDTQSQRQVTWYKYEIDTDLGKLASSVSLTSCLFRIYLHALTSHPLPDPLTSQRGTDLALQELAAASSFSFQQLTKNDVKLLSLIGGITPKREYYPKHLHVMQMTTWSSLLPVLSQHGGFDVAASEIMQYAHSLTVFPELCRENITYKCFGNPFLIARATRRNAIYYEGYTKSLSGPDKEYHSRATSSRSPCSIEALKTSRLVCAWPIGYVADYAASSSSSLITTFQRWNFMKGINPGIELMYSERWQHMDLRTEWLNLYQLCRQIEQSPSRKFELIFSFSALAYSLDQSFLSQIPILLAFASLETSLLDPPPPYSSYDLTDGFEPLRKKVATMIMNKLCRLEDSPASQTSRSVNESSKAFKKRLQRLYADLSQVKIDEFVDRLMNQWPSSNPTASFDYSKEWFRFENLDDVKEYFASCFRNSELKTFASRLSFVLNECATSSPLVGKTIHELRFSPSIGSMDNSDNSYPDLEHLLCERDAPTLAHVMLPFFGFKAGCSNLAASDFGQRIDTAALGKLLNQFDQNYTTPLHRLYHDRLQDSQRELRDQRIPSLSTEFRPPLDKCVAYRVGCENRLSFVFSTICTALAPYTPIEQILGYSGLWPRITRRTIIQQLASSAHTTVSSDWSERLIDFAKVFIEYQHSQRLVEISLRADVINFLKEVDNASFNHMDATRNPHWLLVQIDGNFITRPIQSQVAGEMISPSLGWNIALQLNMGEGKSHVIVPLVASALADSTKLVRIVVLKPLANQMFELLVERLSGLANRRIFYFPFSRDVNASPKVVKTIRSLFEECARVQGILVVQPEHILSFRLMVIDRMSTSEGPDISEAARDLQATQTWLDHFARDILDESDELLHIRYQLIYTMGQQQPVDDGPDRWITIQGVFDRLRHHMRVMKDEFSDEVELFELQERTDRGGFPHFRLLGSSASQALVSKIADDALEGMLESLTFVGLGSNPALRSDVVCFITMRDVDPQIYDSVQCIYRPTSLWKGILLLRGLLAHGILVYALRQRRWRVDYGLDPKRSLLAVPYRAKDVPSLRSEFGHPDVVICLTCLSYYYGGLTTSQVRESFELVRKLDNPQLEYESWVKCGGDGIPSAIRELIGVNMTDVEAFTRDVIPFFQRNKGTIDFFLSCVVFPKEAKEFPSKLGTSGWDLAELRANYTTGFSGTNDNRDLLPTSIAQTDPVNQLRTNAQVLEYLLRPENDKYLCIEGRDGGPCSAAELLDVILKEPKEIRVLLDVGAQMLEMTNREVIQYWLSLACDKDVHAGVFFDDSDNISVLTRDGMVESLHSSPFIHRLHECIVYLDDAHTRGTDLKLPPSFRAMVTLGPKVTKDKIMQGCMRMRNLGHGQSIAFCAPPEVDRYIRKLEKIDHSCSVRVSDVLSWAMGNTCADIKDHMPHWVQQGVYYRRRRDESASSTFSTCTDVRTLKTSWLEPAARTLNEMYGIDTTKVDANKDKDIPSDMQVRLKLLGITEVSSEAMAEEQEREVNHELEEESQIERPPKVPAAAHKLAEEVHNFVRHGIISASSEVFLPLMAPISSDAVGFPWAKQLLCTRDFLDVTTAGNEKRSLTEFLRPINWIVSRICDDGSTILVVVSPHEVNALLDDIRQSKFVRLHVYAPRTVESMKPFNLSFYCIPAVKYEPMTPTTLNNDIGYQLNIWAGQLYLDNYESYHRLCLLLGISSSESDGNALVQSDRFVPKEGRSKEMSAVCLFDKSPLPLLKVLFGLRRKGMSFQSTHMGKILQARLLTPKDFED